MAVQLLENWLLKEQEKIQTKYRELNQVSVLEPDVILSAIRLWNIILYKSCLGLQRRLSIVASRLPDETVIRESRCPSLW